MSAAAGGLPSGGVAGGEPEPVPEPEPELAGPVGAAWNALAGVYDPELYLDVVSLGLVYDIRWQGNSLAIEMTLTTPGCPVSESLPEEARAAVQAAVGAQTTVDVRVVWDPPWSPEMMDRAAASGFRFGS